MLIPRNHAVFSPDRMHRYLLSDVWLENRLYVNFIGVNPSDADEENDDPSVTRMKDFARRWGYGGLFVTNLFAFRSPYPKKLREADDPVGPDNDQWIRKVSLRCSLVVPAWGNNGSYLSRDQETLKLLAGTPLKILGLTKHGHPRHPLFMKQTIRPMDWRR